MTESIDWQSMFVGRKKELKIIEDAWEKAKSGGPQFILLKEGPGFGKTRIIQEFYESISKNEDPDDYWPDRIRTNNQSKKINPDFSAHSSEATLPWLWWGIGFYDPENEKRDYPPGYSLVEGSTSLKAHFGPLVYARTKKKLTKEAATEALKEGANALSFGFLSIAFSVKNVSSMIVKHEQLEHDSSLISPTTTQEKTREDLHDQVFDFLNAVLSTKEKDHKTVPMVLVFDDAHWAGTEQDSLILLERLLRKGKVEKWPLLVLATHWRREWDEQLENVPKESVKEPISLAHLVNKNKEILDENLEPGESWKPMEIEKLNGLSEVLEVAMPGLTEEQLKQIIKQVDGIPDHLFDLVSELLKSDWNFEDRDPQKSLSSQGETVLTELTSLDYGQLLKKRFSSIKEENLKELLAMSSQQDIRYSEELTLEVAKKMALNYPTDQENLDKACRPLAISEKINEQMSEFRVRPFYQLADEFFQKNMQTIHEEFRVALQSVLLEWVVSGQMEKLDWSERVAALNFLASCLPEKPSHEEDVENVGHVFRQLFLNHYNYQLERKSVQFALSLVGSMPKQGWPETVVDYDTLLRVSNSLIQFGWNRESQKFLTVMIPKLFNNKLIVERTPAEQAKQKMRKSMAFINLGNTFMHQGKIQKTIDNWERSVKLGEELLETLADQFTPEMRSNLAMFYSNLGSAYLSQGDLKEAIDNLKKSIELGEELREMLADQFTSEMQKNLSVAYSNLGLGNLYGGELEGAIVSLRKSIKLGEELREILVDQFTPEMQKNLAIGNLNLGMAYYKQGELNDANGSLQRSIELGERLRENLPDQFTPEMQKNLAIGYLNLGAVYLNKGEMKEAVDNLKKSIKLGEKLLETLADQFTPEMQKNLAMGYLNLGTAYLSKGEMKEAADNLKNSIKLGEKLLETLADQFTPEMKNNLALACSNLGVVFYNQNELEEAIDNWKRTVELGEELRETLDYQFTPDMQRSLVLAYLNLGLAYLDSDELIEAIDYSKRSIELSEKLREMLSDQFTPEMQKNLALGHLNLGTAYSGRGELEEAIGNWKRSIELGEELRRSLADQFDRDMQHTLALGYLNLGLTYLDKGELSMEVENILRDSMSLFDDVILVKGFLIAIPDYLKLFKFYIESLRKVHSEEERLLDIIVSKAREFLEELELKFNKEEFPEPWQDMLRDLKMLLDGFD